MHGVQTVHVDVRLKPNDINGFAAAGYCLFTRSDGRIELLMAREERDSEFRLNFVGGKRWKKTETPLQVAQRTIGYETGGQVDELTLSKPGDPFLVYFSSASKYVLFFMEKVKDSIVIHSNPADRAKGEKELVLREFDSPNLSDLHDFAAGMMRDLIDPAFNVLGRIGEMFDVATASRADEDIDTIDKISDILNDMRLGFHSPSA